MFALIGSHVNENEKSKIYIYIFCKLKKKGSANSPGEATNEI